MKYAILIESKNFKFAAIERIAQIINPSVDLETFSDVDIKLSDIISNVLCPLLSLDPVSAFISKAEGFGEADFYTISHPILNLITNNIIICIKNYSIPYLRT